MREQTGRAWRNVRKNEITRIPRKHIFLTASATISRKGTASVRSWGGAVACFMSTRKDRNSTEAWHEFDTPDALWSYVSAFSMSDGRTVLWAHNLGYVARLTDALNSLSRVGFKLVAHNINNRSTWLEWKKDKATLCMADVTSVFPVTIPKLGEWFRLGRLYSDLDDDNQTMRISKSRRDAEIIKEAVSSYLQWLEDEDCGNWQITGAGQSWALFRHKFLTHKMTTHDDESALMAERRAMWSGRCEAYWKGEFSAQTIHEWDFINSYPRIARDCAVPVRLLGPMPDSFSWQEALTNDKVGVLARVRIHTKQPVVPTIHNGYTVWPVGSFETTLWSPELKAAIDAGAEIEIQEAWLYRLRPALKAWGEWILAQLVRPENEVPTWLRAVLKHHSRSLIGRMAMTYNSWELFAEAPDSGVRREKVYDVDTGEMWDLMQIGSEVWRDVGRVEWPHSMPMVTGYIQSIARVELWNLLKALPEGVALYADTDSILVTQNHLETVDRIARELFGCRLRLKRSWDGIAIYGPRQVVTGAQVRVSGVPTNANRVERGVYDGVVWDSLATAVTRGNTGTVTVRPRQWHITGVDHRRNGGIPGWTTPIELIDGKEPTALDKPNTVEHGVNKQRPVIPSTSPR